MTLVFSFSSINVALWCFLLCFFMWFKRFQILICELQSIWLLILSLLYSPFYFQTFCCLWLLQSIVTFKPKCICVWRSDLGSISLDGLLLTHEIHTACTVKIVFTNYFVFSIHLSSWTSIYKDGTVICIWPAHMRQTF